MYDPPPLSKLVSPVSEALPEDPRPSKTDHLMSPSGVGGAVSPPGAVDPQPEGGAVPEGGGGGEGGQEAGPGGRRRRREELQRLHRAQMIQRQLQQVEEKQKQLEERGVGLERVLRGEAEFWGESPDSEDVELHVEGLGKLDRPALMQQLFLLVQQKNCLLRYESELMISAREVELEDRQSRLQQELRDQMAVEDHLKPEVQLVEEVLVLQELLEVVQQRDSLVAQLEEHRLQGTQEDQDLEGVLSQGLGLTWP
ncbi:Protein-methionine sulfoxide oxidase mical3a [Dissostichus eleginoides]|nr:Protein-methionine sulfoxide oxidase mical3a [Dissostichus eleginoides]